jgi:hypothetical protein
LGKQKAPAKAGVFCLINDARPWGFVMMINNFGSFSTVNTFRFYMLIASFYFFQA